MKPTLVTLAVLMLTPAAANTQQQRLPFKGTQAFRNHLASVNLQPVATMAEFARWPPNETVLIVFGDLACLDQLAQVRLGGIKKFVEDGGALLVASDRPDWGRLSAFQLEIPGILPPVPVKKKGQKWQDQPAEPYKEFIDCILIHYHSSLSHPIFAGCTKGIATNSPSYFRRNLGCPYATLGSFQPGFPFAVGSVGKAEQPARVLFLSGHGIFMNGMLVQSDNDNAKFMRNILHWLADDKQRKHCLFLEDNEIMTSFAVPLVAPPLPTVQIINDLLRGLENENFFNHLLLDNFSKRSILRRLLAVALIGLTIYGVYRFLGAGLHKDKAVPTPALALTEQTGPVVQRQEQQLKSRNFLDPARVVARECFRPAGAAQRQASPPVVVQGSWFERRRLQRAVDQLWSLAHGEGEQLSVGAFAHVVRSAARVKAALASGALRFTPS